MLQNSAALAKARFLVRLAAPGPRSPRWGRDVCGGHRPTAQKPSDMLADHRIGRIGQAEFSQPAGAALAGQVANAGFGEKTIKNNLL